MLGLCCCMELSPVAVNRGCSLAAVHGFLLAVAWLIVGHKL